MKEQGTHKVEVILQDNNHVSVYSTVKTPDSNVPWNHDRKQVGDYSSFEDGIARKAKSRRISRALETVSFAGQFPPVGVILKDVADVIISLTNHTPESSDWIPRDGVALAAFFVLAAVKFYARARKITDEQELATITEASAQKNSFAYAHPFAV